jgi:hypothetical protein
MLVSMMSVFKASVQSELNAFCAHLDNQADLIRLASAQAFSKARQQFSHRAFFRLNQTLMRLVHQHLIVPRWNGLRVVAADGTKMQLFLKGASQRMMQEVIAIGLYLPNPLNLTLTPRFISMFTMRLRLRSSFFCCAVNEVYHVFG